MESSEQPAASFEAAYHSLEDVVARLEQGGLSLDETLADFEQGMRLANRCLRLLDEAELRVTRLLADDSMAPESDDQDEENVAE